MQTTLAQIDAACKGLTAEQAEASLRHPYLLHENSQSEIEYPEGHTMNLAYMPTSTTLREAATWVLYELIASSETPGPLSLGRTQANAIVVADPSVSGAHASLQLQPDQRSVLVTDLGSKNGTFVQGKRLEPQVPTETRSGDFITFGRVPLRYMSVEGLLGYMAALRAQGKL